MYRTGVSAIIMNNQEKFLLVNLESFEERYFSIPGGGIDPGETLEQAVYREIQEELGIEKQSLKLVGKIETPLKFLFKKITLNRDGQEYLGSERYFFGFRFIGNDAEITPRKGEVRTFKWVAFDQLKDYLLFDNQLDDTSEKIIGIFPFVKK